MRYLMCVLAAVCVLASFATADEIARQKAEAEIPASMLGKWPNADKAIQSKTDYLGDLAMKQSNGPSYEFFTGLLPSLRYVDTGFRHYPIVFCPPNGEVKARYVSNGSAINALARQINWRGEEGTPVYFHVGTDLTPYGADIRHLDGPRYANGYLPIVRSMYKHWDATVIQEAFGGVDPAYTDSGVVFVRFTGSGQVVARIELTTDTPLRDINGAILNVEGKAIVWADSNWIWEPGGQRLAVELTPGKPALLAVFTRPMQGRLPELTPDIYASQRARCVDVWQTLIGRGTQVETPEPVVNNAWRSLLVGTFELIHGNEVRYSANNQYAKMYIGEGGDTIRALLLWGYPEDARRMLVPLLDYKREGLLYHQAGKKLQFLTHYYQLTGDVAWFRENRDRWMLQANRLINERESGNGLLPREQYCGDIPTPVYSLNSNANAWSGLRDFSLVLDAIGEDEMARKCARAADELRPATLAAVEKSEYRDVTPHFMPMAFFDEEKPYDPLTATRLGGYWDLMAPYVLGSGIFQGTEREDSMLRYLQEMGGLSMGMVRSHPGSVFWMVNQNANDLYTLRYVLTLFRRDEVDRALVSLYGKLAQGLTRDTFIGGEGSCLMPVDESGRQMYLPPNSAGNAHFLWMLRYTMVQDWDLDNDGRPETLRLMFATPKRWMEDGKTTRIEHAPTAFGEVSVIMRSTLNRSNVTAEVTAPERTPGKTLLRARVPDGWKVTSAKIGNKTLPVDKQGTVDISGMRGKFTVVFGAVRK